MALKIKKKVEVSLNRYHDLREVMDYNRDFSIFFSGVEYEVYFSALFDYGVRNFLVSYEYARTKGASALNKYRTKGLRLFVDSGAFTIFSDPEYAKYTNEQWEERIVQYLDWARKNKDIIFAIADLDLQAMVGLPLVTQWRQKYFEPFMLETGIPVCMVWHDCDGDAVWEQMCQRYPYIATSLASDQDIDVSKLMSKFRIAEKYNTLIQGMGTTRTGILQKLPFYTVDSTTWKSGLRYGKLNLWYNKKMKVVLKDDLQKYRTTIEGYGFNFQKLVDEDVVTVVQANARAYIEAEKYIVERLKPLMYWQKPTAKKNNLEELLKDPEFFPTPEQLMSGDIPDLQKTAEKMNINSDLNRNQLITLISDMTAFLNWDRPKYKRFIEQTYTDAVVMQNHTAFVNTMRQNTAEMVDDLVAFYASCITGENTKLLFFGTNFDRMAKERDEYLEEEETELVDIPFGEMTGILGKLLPAPTEDGSPAPDIDALDDEIFEEVGIIPVRDDKGRFLKGQRAVLKPKKVYSEKYPKYVCDTCYASSKCPEYKAGYVCAYQKLFKRFSTRNTDDIVQAMQGMVEHNLARMQRAMVVETMEGGVPDPAVSSMIQQNMNLLNAMNNLYAQSGKNIAQYTKTVKADGSVEETAQVNSKGGSSILDKLFSSMNKGKEEPKDENIKDAGGDEPEEPPKRVRSRVYAEKEEDDD